MHAHDGSKLSASLRTPQKMRSPRANQERRASQCYSLLPQLRRLFRRFALFAFWSIQALSLWSPRKRRYLSRDGEKRTLAWTTYAGLCLTPQRSTSYHDLSSQQRASAVIAPFVFLNYEPIFQTACTHLPKTRARFRTLDVALR